MSRISLNRNQLKYLAILAMLVDHIAWAFVPTESAAGFFMHLIGRFTAPTMLFFLVEGYLHTHSLRRYARRLAVFALISWVPCSLFEFGRWPEPFFGMIWTVLLALGALWIWDREQMSETGKVLAVFGLCVLSVLGDWPVMGILFPLNFYINRDDERKKWGIYAAISIVFGAIACMLSGPWHCFQFGTLLAPLLLRRYNGEPGSGAAFHKWFFYVFYPAHLLLLWWLTSVL